MTGFFGPLISKFWTRVCKLESKSDDMSLADVGDDLDSHSSGTGVEVGLVEDWGCSISPNGSKAKKFQMKQLVYNDNLFLLKPLNFTFSST